MEGIPERACVSRRRYDGEQKTENLKKLESASDLIFCLTFRYPRFSDNLTMPSIATYENREVT